MLKSVVCKMKCHVAPVGEAITNNPQTVRLGAVFEPDMGVRELPENAVFGNATPWGEFAAGIAPAASKALFVPGRSYYVTITEAPD
jgi:hypothetical protein